MKFSALKFVLIFTMILAGYIVSAQTAQRSFPETFVIKQKEIDKLFLHKPGTRLSARGNKYLSKGIILVNTKNGDIKYLKLQLNSFKNAFLNVQVNGTFSTQVFIASDDKSVFYKGRVEKGQWLMKKCDEDEIVSE